MRRVFIILFLQFLMFSIAFAEKDYLYSSYKKFGDKLYIGIEGYVYYKDKRYYTSELNYEWTINIGDELTTERTYSPFLVLDIGNYNTVYGSVKIFPSNMSFIKTFPININISDYIVNPSVSIIKYDPDLNLVLPFSKIVGNEKLYALTYGFSSKNLSYEWDILGNKYSGIIIDPKNLQPGTIINLRVKNLDNLKETASDIKVLE
ncbi:MAG: hypothetical protein ACP5JU_01900 [Minisyncoccia bacterium]